MISSTECLVAMTALWVAPYSLPQGTPVLAQVRARNARGWGAYSPVTVTAGAALVETVPVALAAPSRGTLTSDSQLQVDWVAPTGTADGGSVILGYAVYWDDATAASGTQVWTELIGESSTHTAVTYTRSTGITGGAIYAVKVKAKNKWGWGPFSAVTSILAATVPGAPGVPVTAIDAATGGVSVTWAAPGTTGGVAVTAYRIEVKGGDGVWRTDSSCDGTTGATSPVVTGRSCIIPMANLVAAGSHALAFDALVVVRVAAGNVRGYGLTSENTSGARIRQAPAAMSAPLEGAGTSDSQVEVTWSAVTSSGLPTGNSPTTGYRLSWDNGEPGRATTAFLPFPDQVATTYVLTGVTKGAYYRFMVQAINIYGAGPASPAASIRASAVPSQVPAPTTVRSGTDIVVTWTLANDNGAALTAQELYVLTKPSNTYVTDTAVCNPGPATLTCTWSIAYLRASHGYSIGDLVQFKVRAQNADGAGALSNANAGGATI